MVLIIIYILIVKSSYFVTFKLILTKWMICTEWIKQDVVCGHLVPILLFLLLLCLRYQILDHCRARSSTCWHILLICISLPKMECLSALIIIQCISILIYFIWLFLVLVHFWTTLDTWWSPIGKITELNICVQHSHGRFYIIKFEI